MWQSWDSYICHFENLEPYPQGQFIFDWIDSFEDTFFEDVALEFKNRWKELMKVRQANRQSQLKLFQ